MKRLHFFLATFLFITTSWAQNNVGINDDNSSAKASAMLDVYSSTKGILIPRVVLTSTTVAAPVTTPEASLLIYNTATTGDVTPGYYYWDGTSKWVRLLASADKEIKLNTVTKTTNSTLLKTENMVFASGDIILTLPTVTSADDGLEISIKNVGTYTDLISVIPESGKTIDATTISKLTRWRGRTFIAYGSNWIIREKETRADNLLDVSPAGSFKSIEEVVAFLNEHMAMPAVVRLGGGTFTINTTQTINLPYPVTFEGLSFGETIITGTGSLFSCATETYFKRLVFNGSGGNAISFTGSEVYSEVKDCTFDGFSKGVVTTSNTDLWIFENDFENCTAAAIEIAAGSASGGRLRVSETDFGQCAVGINLLSGVAEIVSILNSVFYNTASGSDIGINYSPATFTSFQSILISNNGWNNQGSFMSGFDFTRSDARDADAFIIGNAGIEDMNPHCKINVSNNGTTTTITTAGTYYKANWTNAATSSTCKWTLANNRITYQPKNGKDVWAIITGNISVNNANRVITIAFVKNGVSTTRYGETDLRITTGNQPFQFSTVIFIENVAKNDYIELWVSSANSADIIKFQDIQWFTDTK